MDDELRSALELAEEPTLWLPGALGSNAFHGEGFAFVLHGRAAYVHHLRLKGSEVAPTVDRIAGMMAIRGYSEATWWIGRLSRPKDLVERLLDLGLTPDEPSRLTTAMITRPPAFEWEREEAPDEPEPTEDDEGPTDPDDSGDTDGGAREETDLESSPPADEAADASAEEDLDEHPESDEAGDDSAEELPESRVNVRHVETLEEYLTALEIDWECFSIPEEERELRRAEAKEAWPQLMLDPRMLMYLADIEGETVGFARAIFNTNGAVLLGSATIPEARGQGVYTALVKARWADAAARHTPRVSVAAGRESGAILRKLGFERIGQVSLLKQKI